METTQPGRNTALAELLHAAGWSRVDTARKVRERAQRLGHPGIAADASRVTRWINNGECPRPPTGEILAELLSEHFGVRLTLADLGLPQAPGMPAIPADHGLDLPWDERGLQQLTEGWHVHMLSRRTFLAVSGAALTAPGWAAVDTPPPAFAAASTDRVTIGAPHLAALDVNVAHAQQLDDRYGAAARDFVVDQFHAVARLYRTGEHSRRINHRLAAALAQLAQTTGWMEHEARNDGHAQRWYLTGLRASHAAHDPALTASILALMSNQAVTLDNTSDGLQLAAASQEAATRAPGRVQALVAARAGLAYAAAGDLTNFRRARDAALNNLEHSPSDDQPPPRWAAYVSPTELDAIAGRGLLSLASRLPVRAHTLLAEAETLLQGRANTDLAGSSQRSALRHGVLLAHAYTRTGNFDQAIPTAHRALARLESVASARILQMVRELRSDLAQPSLRTIGLSDLLREIDERLSTGPARPS